MTNLHLSYLSNKQNENSFDFSIFLMAKENLTYLKSKLDSRHEIAEKKMEV